jgi:hypothetical protein
VSRRVVVDAPAAELFALLADPYRHGEVDGSGTVGGTVAGPAPLQLGDRFTVRMTFHGLPYRLTSTVTGLEEDRLVEWRHPFGHHWRWQFREVATGRTEVTETWDFAASRRPAFLELIRYERVNAAGIERTLGGLRDRYAASGR